MKQIITILLLFVATTMSAQVLTPIRSEYRKTTTPVVWKTMRRPNSVEIRNDDVIFYYHEGPIWVTRKGESVQTQDEPGKIQITYKAIDSSDKHCIVMLAITNLRTEIYLVYNDLIMRHVCYNP